MFLIGKTYIKGGILMKKFSAFLFVLIVAMLLPSNISASEKNETDPDVALKEILDLRVNSKFESYGKRVIDDRYDTEEEKMKEYLDGSLNGDPLINYEVLDKNIVSSNKLVYTVKMEYESGYVYEHNVNLVKYKDDWYINILNELLEDNTDFKLVKKSKEVEQLIEEENTEIQNQEINNNENDVGIMVGSLVKSFYGTLKGELYSSNFYIPGPSLILGINEQRLDSGYSMRYRLYKDTYDGWINCADKRVYNNVTSSQGYITSYSADVSGRTKVFLRIDGSGYTRGGIYY